MGEAVYERKDKRSPSRKAIVIAAPILGLALTGCFGSHSSPPVSAERRPSNSATASAGKTPTPQATPSESVSSTAPAIVAGLAGCKPYFDLSRYRNHEYEVCTAYIANSAEIALRGLYKYGNNRIGYLSATARHHFETRYWDGPRKTIEHEVDSWPKVSKFAGNNVDASVTVKSLSSSLQADRAVLTIQESWTVTAPDGHTLLSESNQTKDITMCRGRLPGHPLHEWVVVSYTRQPDFDCFVFDHTNGLAP